MTPTDPQERPATVLQSIEEVRNQLERPATIKESVGTHDSTGFEVVAFRPLHRPPIPMLYILDDQQKAAEVVRLRKSPFTIGRLKGDIVLPLDSQLSGEHAQLTVREQEGQHTWWLKDLGSTNGTFVRASRIVLHPNQMLFIGGRRYIFAAPKTPLSGTDTSATDVPVTREWRLLSSQDASDSSPLLVELTEQGEGSSFPIMSEEQWIGRDRKHCSIILDDPMVSPRHARLSKNRRGRWCIEDAKSLNGVWAAVDEIALGKGGYFQCGEQRFLFRINESQ